MLTRSSNHVTVAKKFIIPTVPPLQGLKSSRDTDKSIHKYITAVSVLRGNRKHTRRVPYLGDEFTEKVTFKLRHLTQDLVKK